MIQFKDMLLPEAIHKAAKDLNYITPTPIQQQVIPWLLDNDKDLIGLAQTGTGKTAAFGFPVLAKTDPARKAVQTLILCPTRELCIQIARDFSGFAKYLPAIKVVAVYGGAPIYSQKEALKKGAHIVVGTPGRVFDMIRQNVLKLEQIEHLILDEADEMLNMGFKDDIFEIMSHTPAQKQILLFSATMPRDVVAITETFMREPHRIAVGNQDQGVANIQHFYYKVHARDKYKALKRIADMSPKIYGIIFCKTRTETQEIADKLQHDGYNADALHGDLSQSQRDLVMNRFRNKYVQLLVATDVAARGLDVDDLTHIINYQPPMEPDIYIHRSGRTGRAGKSGVSITIVNIREMAQLKAMERRLGREITLAHVPTGRDICEKQLFNLIDNMENIEVDDEQIDPLMENVYKKLSWLSREELIKRFVSVEFNRFLNYYKDAADLDWVAETAPAVKRDKREVVFSRFQLNIGFEDNLTKLELMKLINRLNVARGIEIGVIEINERDSFIELDSQYNQQMLKALNHARCAGRSLQATVVEEQSSRKKLSFRQEKGSQRYQRRPEQDRRKFRSRRSKQ
jgi:ATP-dependent RNA helicase DeaD